MIEAFPSMLFMFVLGFIIGGLVNHLILWKVLHDYNRTQQMELRLRGEK